jgi:anaerobic selenocysteine-containing dehydrogenase
MNKTACPLDCYDACSIVYDNNRLKGDAKHPLTQGFLCPHLNHYEQHERIVQPRYQGKTISMDDALEILTQKLRSVPAHRTLHLRGHGNFALMQGVSDHFFASHGARLTRGSLCDGAGEAGILQGRGSNKLFDLQALEQSEVVIVWGRNIHVSNSHYLPLLRNKKLIVIDPVRTKLADQADLFIQIKPHGDLYLALLLSRFAIIEGLEDKAFLEQFASDYHDFYELTQQVRIKASLEKIDVTLGEIGKVLELVRDQKTMILVGLGIQKYRNGADVMRAIDAFGVIMGYFGKEGCGVNFLGHSSEGIVSPFKSDAKRVTLGDADFIDFDLVFVQGMNPLSQFPDTNRVEQQLSHHQTLVYFGLYENESSARADLVIPAKSFLEKEDVRVSYGSNDLLLMPKQIESTVGISEYDLTVHLCNAFNIEIKSEEAYISHFKSYQMQVKSRLGSPYRKGFDTDDGAFVFLDEFDGDVDLENDLFLITCKSPRSLNSQFKRESQVYVHPSLGYLEGQRLRIVSQNGSVELEAKFNERLRSDCVLIYSGTPGVNRLSSSKLSYEGANAAYQENKIKVEIC